MHTLLLTNVTPPLSQNVTNFGPRPLKYLVGWGQRFVTVCHIFYLQISNSQVSILN